MDYRVLVDALPWGGGRHFRDHDERERARNALKVDFHSRCVQFSCDPKDLGAYVRAALWMMGISFQHICDNTALVLVQARDDAGWQNVGDGDWDCAGVDVSHSRF